MIDADDLVASVIIDGIGVTKTSKRVNGDCSAIVSEDETQQFPYYASEWRVVVSPANCCYFNLKRSFRDNFMCIFYPPINATKKMKHFVFQRVSMC